MKQLIEAAVACFRCGGGGGDDLQVVPWDPDAVAPRRLGSGSDASLSTDPAADLPIFDQILSGQASRHISRL